MEEGQATPPEEEVGHLLFYLIPDGCSSHDSTLSCSLLNSTTDGDTDVSYDVTDVFHDLSRDFDVDCRHDDVSCALNRDSRHENLTFGNPLCLDFVVSLSGLRVSVSGLLNLLLVFVLDHQLFLHGHFDQRRKMTSGDLQTTAFHDPLLLRSTNSA